MPRQRSRQGLSLRDLLISAAAAAVGAAGLVYLSPGTDLDPAGSTPRSPETVASGPSKHPLIAGTEPVLPRDGGTPALNGEKVPVPGKSDDPTEGPMGSTETAGAV